MRALRNVIVACCLLSAASAVCQEKACDVVLSGWVLDDHDRTPLAFAEVFFPDLGRGAVSDTAGRFSLAKICPGVHRIRVSHLGCEPVEQTLDLRTGKEVVFKLEHHAHELHEFEVARSRPNENVGYAEVELGKEDMELNTGSSLADMLAQVNGVTILSSGPTIGKPVIHGLSGNRVLILNQGVRQEDQQWGTEHAPGLDPFSSDKLTVVKGAASVQYGSDALGGVLITEPVELPRLAGIEGELRGFGAWNGRGGGGNGMLQGGVKGVNGFGWRVQGSGRALGDSRAPGYVLSNTGMNETGVSASMGYRDHRWNISGYYSRFGRETGILRASHIGNITDLENAIATGTPWYVADPTYAIEAPRQEAVHHLAKAEIGYAVSERGRLRLTYGYQTDSRQEYDIRRGGRSGIPAIDLHIRTHTGDAILDHWLGKRVHGKVGVSVLSQLNENVPGTGIRPLIPNYRKETAGVFLLEHFPLSERVELEVGGRLEGAVLDIAKYDFADSLVRTAREFSNSAFTVGAHWNMSDSIGVRLNLGTAFRPPHVSELYSEGLHHGAAAVELGDDQLGSERSYKATADLDAKAFKGKVSANITLYADRIDNYIYLRPDGVQLTIRGAFPVFQYVATDVFLYGVDANLMFAVNRTWALVSRTSLVRGNDLVIGGPLFQIPSDRTSLALRFGRGVMGKWRSPEAELSYQMVFQQWRVPPGLDFMDPPPTYGLLGLRLSATRPLGRSALRMGFVVTNALNTAYRDYMDRFRYYADARGVDINLWIRYSFGGPPQK